MIGSTPKYMQKLHLAVCAIGGTPRIYKEGSTPGLSDSYKDIPEEEFLGAFLAYFNHTKENNRRLTIADNWTFFLGGNPTSKENLIKILEDAIEEVKKLPEDD